MKLVQCLESFIRLLILLSVIAFALETEPVIQSKFSTCLYIFEVFTVGVFTIEYLTRLFISKKKLSYIFSFYGLIDLIAILPFYLSFGIDTRSLRIVRILRILKFGKYSNAMNRYVVALKSIKNELSVFCIITFIAFYVSAVGIYFFERAAQPEVFGSVLDSFWWAIVTLTTVGYGDAFPITPGGKIFTSFIVIIGIAVVAVPTGLISSALTTVITHPKK
jgi:voltage-gated potassium channel